MMNYFLLRQREKLCQHCGALWATLLSILLFVVAHHLKTRLPAPYHQLPSLAAFTEFVWCFVPIWYLLFYVENFFQVLQTKSNGSIFSSIVQRVTYGVLIIIAYLYLFKRDELSSRLLLGFFYLLDITGLMAGALLWRWFLKMRRGREGYWQRKILVVGPVQHRQEIIQVLHANQQWGMSIVGVLDMAPSPDSDASRSAYESLALAEQSTNNLEPNACVDKSTNQGAGAAYQDGNHFDTVSHPPVLGELEELEEVLGRGGIDEVIFAISLADLARIKDYLMICQEFGVDTRINSRVFTGLVAHTRLDVIGGLPLLTFSTTPPQVWQLLIKGILDRIFAAIFLVLLSPVFLVVGLMVKLTSKGPVFFAQERSGLNGRKFTCYKFRTMVQGADQLQAKLASQNEVSGPVFKIKNDPRFTPIGRFLRRTSLDELPQLYNILIGDMSFIGPRPPIPAEVEQYERWQRRRLSMKPGLSCIWQISGRSNIGFAEWMRMDLEYIDNWSLKLDFIILLKTIPAVISGTGAM